MKWTRAEIAMLTELWLYKHTASHIGAVVSKTKDAVIGKAHRLGLPLHAPARPKDNARRPSPR